jgi:hypothetical protein
MFYYNPPKFYKGLILPVSGGFGRGLYNRSVDGSLLKQITKM